MKSALSMVALWAMGAAILITAVLSSPVAASDQHDVIVKGSKLYDSPISLYQGRWYTERHNETRVCIRHRESRHEYAAVSSTGKYRGAYQFSPELMWFEFACDCKSILCVRLDRLERVGEHQPLAL